MDLSKLLLLAGYATSVGVKKDREAAALEADEQKKAKAAAAQAAEAERVRLDEQQMRYVYIDPQGNPGINAIGSPVKLPHGSKIIKMGNFKSGFQDYKGESKIDDLFSINGVPMTKGQIAMMTSTPQNTFISQGVNAPRLDNKIQMKLGSKDYPYVGQVIDGKNHLMEASKSKMLTGPDINTFETKYSIGGNIVSEKEAIRRNQETGLPIRQITSAYTNNNLVSTKEENYEEPGMQEGEKYYYVVGKSPSGKDQIIKRKREADLIGLGYGQDAILTGNFAGDRLVKQIATAATRSTAMEYQRADGSTILDTDDNFTNDDRKNAVGQRLVEISADGKTVTPKGNFSSNVKQDSGKLKNAIDLSKYTAYMKLEDGTIIGKKDEQDINEGLTSINASLFNRIPDFKNKPELAREFVTKFGPLIVQKLRPTIVQEGQVTANLTADAQNDALTTGYGAMLEIPGMMDYLRSVDLQGNIEKKQRLQTSMMNTNPDGPNVVVDEPITAPDGQEIGHLIYGKMATPKYKPFLTNTLYPKLLAATNDPQKAQNLLATFIQDKVNPVTNEVIQRPDGSGPVVSENQSVIDNMQSMANTIIVPGRVETLGPPGDGQQQTVIKPVTELDGFMAMINAADPDSDPILAALDAPTKKRISNKAVAMANNDTEALVLTVRGLISVSGPYVTTLLNRKYGIDNSSQGQQRRNAFRTQAESTNRADRVVKSALRTYFTSDGKPLSNTAVANLDLTFDGLKYLGTELVTRLRGAIGGDEFDATEIGDGVVNQLLSALTAQGVDPTEVFDQSAITAFRQDASEVAQKLKDAKGRNAKETEAKKLLAAREFHITVLAYELAAAIQGGTGGRTISDQDVALILGSLRQKLTATPASQRAALLAARDMVKEIRIRAQYLSSDNVLDNAAMAITDDMMSRADVIITPQSAAARIRQATATGPDLTAEMSDEDLLKVYNNALSLRNKPTVTELTDEIRNSELFKSSVEGLRRR